MISEVEDSEGLELSRIEVALGAEKASDMSSGRELGFGEVGCSQEKVEPEAKGAAYEGKDEVEMK